MGRFKDDDGTYQCDILMDAILHELSDDTSPKNVDATLDWFYQDLLDETSTEEKQKRIDWDYDGNCYRAYVGCVLYCLDEKFVVPQHHIKQAIPAIQLIISKDDGAFREQLNKELKQLKGALIPKKRKSSRKLSARKRIKI